jgi:hypothetical protein
MRPVGRTLPRPGLRAAVLILFFSLCYFTKFDLSEKRSRKKFGTSQSKLHQNNNNNNSSNNNIKEDKTAGVRPVS